jgi:hypothetical protein
MRAISCLGLGTLALACTATGNDQTVRSADASSDGWTAEPPSANADAAADALRDQAAPRVDAVAATDAAVSDAGAGRDGPDAADQNAPSGQAPYPLVSDFIGVNGFIDDPVDKLATIGNVREYHNWSWCEGNGATAYPGYPNNQNAFSLWNGFWDFDAYYADLAAKGVFAYPVIQQGVSWINGGAVPPVAAGSDPTIPQSYAAHADHLFQYAARYGRVKVADNLLKLATDQKRVSGLDTLRYIEDYNEQDANWILPSSQPLFTAAQYAAMASADYDGDERRMGTTVGVKNADPQMKLVMGGLAGSGTGVSAWEKSVEAYVDGIRAWAASHRAGNFPADVINVHYYSFGPDPFGTANPRPASSPEADKVQESMALLRAYRDRNLPGKELWLTEFGYDTDNLSRLRAPAIGQNPAPIVQGQWLVRYVLALMAAGLDRAFVFMLRDGCEGSNCHVQFDTCGLMTVKDKWLPKPSYFFLATLRSRLGPFGWAGEASSDNPNVRIARFKDPSNAKGAYVLWAPTSNDTTVAAYELPIGAASSAMEVRLVDQRTSGADAPLAIAQGTVRVDVGETPVIVLVDAI